MEQPVLGSCRGKVEAAAEAGWGSLGQAFAALGVEDEVHLRWQERGYGWDESMWEVSTVLLAGTWMLVTGWEDGHLVPMSQGLLDRRTGAEQAYLGHWATHLLPHSGPGWGSGLSLWRPWRRLNLGPAQGRGLCFMRLNKEEF